MEANSSYQYTYNSRGAENLQEYDRQGVYTLAVSAVLGISTISDCPNVIFFFHSYSDISFRTFRYFNNLQAVKCHLLPPQLLWSGHVTPLPTLQYILLAPCYRFISFRSDGRGDKGIFSSLNLVFSIHQ